MTSGSGCEDGAESSAAGGKRVIVIGMDGLDPRLATRMMDAGELPNFDKLRKAGGFRPLGTSIPPQSPVAWSNFITGAGPGSHGIFDFVHRHPEKSPTEDGWVFYSASETVKGEGGWEVGDHKLAMDFWPFNHTPTQTLLKREGTPFWDYLDAAGIPTRVYDIPADYPPSPSKHGHHCCLSGMGVPDLLGSYGTYQYFGQDVGYGGTDEPGGKRTRIRFKKDMAELELVGPRNDALKAPQDTKITFHVHRDRDANAAVIDIQDHRILLAPGEWSDWTRVTFTLAMPNFMPDQTLSGICRFYLQSVSPDFRLYVTPVNIDPTDPAVPISEPPEFVERISEELGLFYTSGFQEDHKARSNDVFTDEEYAQQAEIVIEERLNLLDYAMEHYEDGLLFFYFSSTDLQAHIFFWDQEANPGAKHPVRSPEDVAKYREVVKRVYRRMDDVVGRVVERWGSDATIMIMSDHGFANFERQFNLNTWLRDNGYIRPADCRRLMGDCDWLATRAYGIGLNGLYLNLRGREKHGIVDPRTEKDALLNELIEKLEAVRDEDGRKVICKVDRADEAYKGPHSYLAPDLIVGYCRGYRSSWDTALGDMSDEVLRNNDSAWSADHCMASAEVPGVLFSNRPIAAASPALIDMAPTILSEFGVAKPAEMAGRSVFESPPAVASAQ